MPWHQKGTGTLYAPRGTQCRLSCGKAMCDGAGRGRGQWGLEWVLPGSGCGLILLLTCCLHLSPSFRAALLSISSQHMQAHRKAAPAPTSPFPRSPQERSLQTHLSYHQTRACTPSAHPPCENSQPGSPNASSGSYKKVDVFFRNASSPAEHNFKGATSRSLSFPLQRARE